MKSELFLKVNQRKEGEAGIKTFPVFSVAAFDFAVVARSITTDELAADTELRGGVFKQGGQVPLGVGETVGERKAVACLDTLHCNAPAGIPLYQPFQKVGRRIGGMLR